jgi:hypothetical protein
VAGGAEAIAQGGKAIGSVSADARGEVLTELEKEIVLLAATSRDDTGPPRSPHAVAPRTVSEGRGSTTKANPPRLERLRQQRRDVIVRDAKTFHEVVDTRRKRTLARLQVRIRTIEIRVFEE